MAWTLDLDTLDPGKGDLELCEAWNAPAQTLSTAGVGFITVLLAGYWLRGD